MTEPTVLIEIDPRGVATLTLNRPEVHNAFDDALINALDAALEQLDRDSGVRVVVLAAAGKSFSAGADLNWMRRTAEYSQHDNLEDARRLAALMDRLWRLGKPTIARVQGAAFGGGVGLVACCDIAVASQDARFALSEVKLGLIPAVISPYVVRAMGERQARRYMLTAERFSAEDARRVGLVHEVAPADSLDERVESMVTSLLDNGPRAMASVKRLVERVSEGGVDGAMLDDVAGQIAQVRASDEGREGVKAFLEKRKPRWPNPSS